MTAVDTLRTAAAMIRERAQSATPGPWLDLNWGDRIIRDHDGPVEYVVDEPMSHAGNAWHIATWSPDRTLIVAELLDAIAQDAEDNAEFDGFDPAVVFPPSAVALRLAALIVGEAS